MRAMKKIKLLSWNVNGIRAAFKKGFAEWLEKESPDILCIQETKAQLDQITKELSTISGYHTYFCSAERKGYSGVAVFSKEKPVNVAYGMGDPIFDNEGRTLVVEYPTFTLFNIYYPNGGSGPERLQYKMNFYEYFTGYVMKLKQQGKNIVICGDVNTAHKEIDLARPKENQKTSGFMPMEREWVEGFLQKGFLDTLRMFNQEAGQYSWWDMKSGARARNIGWRIDYFFVSENFKSNVKHGFIMPEVLGSDHCPVGIDLEV
jgi:exodeoxyribonuclease III